MKPRPTFNGDLSILSRFRDKISPQVFLTNSSFTVLRGVDKRHFCPKLRPSKFPRVKVGLYYLRKSWYPGCFEFSCKLGLPNYVPRKLSAIATILQGIKIEKKHKINVREQCHPSQAENPSRIRKTSSGCYRDVGGSSHQETKTKLKCIKK